MCSSSGLSLMVKSPIYLTNSSCRPVTNWPFNWNRIYIDTPINILFFVALMKSIVFNLIPERRTLILWLYSLHPTISISSLHRNALFVLLVLSWFVVHSFIRKLEIIIHLFLTYHILTYTHFWYGQSWRIGKHEWVSLPQVQRLVLLECPFLVPLSSRTVLGPYGDLYNFLCELASLSGCILEMSKKIANKRHCPSSGCRLRKRRNTPKMPEVEG